MSSSPAEEEVEVPVRVHLTRFNLGHRRDSEACSALKDKLCCALSPHSGGSFSFLDCLVDSESSSVIESESKGTAAQSRALGNCGQSGGEARGAEDFPSPGPEARDTGISGMLGFAHWW